MVASVPHTGTNLISRILHGAGYHDMHPGDARYTDDGKIHARHVTEPSRMADRRVIIGSVPHTGTNLMKEILKYAGYRTMSPSDHVASCKKIAHVAHVLKETQISQILSLGRDWPVVCPLRHPYRVAESWRRMSWPWTEDEMVEAFRVLVNRIIVPLGASVVPVDSPFRDGYLRALGERIGEDLKSDWPIVAPKANTHGLSMDELSPTPKTEALVREIGEFLGEYYP